MIEVHQHRIRLLPFQATPDEAETAKMAVNSYGFILKDHPFGSVGRYSFADFANKIEQQCDVTTPRNAEVVRVLQILEQRNNAPVH